MLKIIVLTSLSLLTFQAFGCTCPDFKDKELIRRSEYAFIGIVVSNIYKDEWTEEFIGGQGIRPDAKVRVIKVLKGEIIADEVIVMSGERCSIYFVPGRRYLITGTNKLNRLPPLVIDTLPTVEFDSTFLTDTTRLEQPVIKHRDDWTKELQLDHLVIFTSVCQTRCKK